MNNADWLDLTMGDIGEKGFLRKLLPTLEQHASFVNGFGDDASAIRISEDRLLVFKVDRAAAPMAARRGWSDYKLWGRLAATSNCSDVLTAGGAPVAVMIAMILPRDWKVKAAVDAIQGCAQECSANNIAFAGGDTKEGPSPEIIGSAVGICREDQLLTRHGASPGDLIAVAGEVGGFLGSYLQITEALETDSRHRNVDSWKEYVTYPRARWREAEAMRELGIATAAMDTSDGLYDAVTTLASGQGADIQLDSLPYHKIAHECSRRLHIDPFNLALGVGDWNIVYTVNPREWENIRLKLADRPVRLSVIGRLGGAEGVRWHDTSGGVFQCSPIVNEHFVGRLEDESSLLDRLRKQSLLLPL